MDHPYYHELKDMSIPKNSSFAQASELPQKETPRETRRKILKEKVSSNLTHFDKIATKKNDNVCLVALIGTSLTIVLLLTDYDPETRTYENTTICYLLKTLIFISTVILIFLQINYYYVLGMIENNKWGFPSFWSSLFDTSLIKKASLEIIICAIHPLPFFSAGIDSVGLLMIFRVFLFIRYLKYHSNIFQLRHKILNENPYLKRHRPIFGWKLVLKSYFYSNPVMTLVSTYSFILLTGAFCIHVAERADNDNLTDYGNSLYLTIISCASIGYGDITPNTYTGKFIVCMFALIGITTLSLLVNVGDRAIRMRTVELFSVDYVSILILRSKTANISASYLQCFWKLRGIMKKNGKKWPYTPEEASKLNILQQRLVAILVGKIKEASRSMHRYRIRELALNNFKAALDEKNEEDADDEKENEEDLENTKQLLQQNFFTDRMKREKDAKAEIQQNYEKNRMKYALKVK